MSHWGRANVESKFPGFVFVHMVGGSAGERRARAFSQFRNSKQNDLNLWLLGFEVLVDCTDRDSW